MNQAWVASTKNQRNTTDMNIRLDVAPQNIYTLDDVFNDINQAKSLYFEGKFDEAYPIIIKAARTFDMCASIGLTGNNLNKPQYKAVYMLAGDICGELGKFDEALVFYQKHQYFNLQINHDFRDTDRVTLFQFRNTRTYTLNNLRNNQITLVDPRVQNDIVDSPIFSWLNTLCGHNVRHKKHLAAFKASFNYLRATSFCTNSTESKAVENTLMWAHYANCHKGICVQYELGEKDFSSNRTQYATLMRLMRIKYINPDIASETLDFTNPETKFNIRTALATKSIDWDYENEVRMIAYVPTEERKYVQCTLETPNPIKAIYFGVKCPPQRKNAVRKIFETRPEVKFYQMSINPHNIHRLIYTPI